VACCIAHDGCVSPLMRPLRQSQTFTSWVTYPYPSTPQLTPPKHRVECCWGRWIMNFIRFRRNSLWHFEVRPWNSLGGTEEKHYRTWIRVGSSPNEDRTEDLSLAARATCSVNMKFEFLRNLMPSTSICKKFTDVSEKCCFHLHNWDISLVLTA
jgi:hypothetical protein